MILCIHHIYQSNDSFLKQFLPIFCVILGIGISEIIGYFRRGREIEETAQNFIMQIISAQNIIAKQVNNIEEYVTDLKSKTPSKFAIEVLSLLDFKRISVFNRLHVYKYFKRICHEKTEAMDVVDNLYASIDAIGFNMHRTLKDFDAMTGKMAQLGEEITFRIIKIRNEIGDWRIKQGNLDQATATTDKFFNYLVNDVIPIISDHSYHILELNEKLFHPLIDKCIEYNEHQLAESFKALSREGSDIIHKMNREKTITANRLEAYAGSMKKHNDVIVETIEKYKLKEHS